MARKGKNRDLRHQAQDEARLRYNPQLRTLASMLADSQAATRSDVTSARAQGAAMSDYIKRQTPALQGIYAQSGKDLGSLTNLISQAIGQSHGGLASGAINSELRQQAQNLAGDQSRSVGDFAQRGADAQAGAVLASRLARQAGRVDQSKIQGQIAGVAGDAGTYTAARYADLVNGRRQRSLTKRGQDKTAASSAAARKIQRENLTRQELKDQGLDINGKPLPKKPSASKGPKLNSGKDHQKLRSQIDTAVNEAKTLLSTPSVRKLSPAGRRNVIGQLLQSGAQPVKHLDPNTGLQTTVDPGFKPFDRLTASVALDTVFDGGVSRKNHQELNRNGYSLKGLSLPSAKKHTAPTTKQSISGTVKAVKGLL